MKRALAMIGAACVFLCSFTGYSAFAAEPKNGAEQPSAAAPANTANPVAADPSGGNVTITVVLPDKEAPAPEEPVIEQPSIIKAYPSDVTEMVQNGDRLIVKTYELNAGEKPEDIPREPFERGGWRYSLTDITRRETATAETMAHTETVTVSTDTRELEQILTLLDPTMEYISDDGFTGTLSLDVSSIKVETAGTRTSSYTMSVTREYPLLSSNDVSLVPKTVTDRGTTYTLAGVDWRAGNTVAVDYTALPEYYTAFATYTTTGSSTRVTGYTTTADYSGTLARLSQGKTIYTAYFLGVEIRTPLEMTAPSPDPAAATAQQPSATPVIEPTTEPSAEPVHETDTETSPEPETAPAETPQAGGRPAYHRTVAIVAIIAIVTTAAAVTGGAFYYIRKKGKQDEKTDNHDPDAADDNGSGGSGSGG